jgi:hypothetical protein
VWTVAAGPQIEAADVDDAEPGYEAKLDASFLRAAPPLGLAVAPPWSQSSRAR